MLIDPAARTATLRIVFAGAPRAGKTALVRTLALELFGADRAPSVISPAEAEERTLFFDWLEYDGGMNSGFRIHSQIISVPGQQVLRHRRRLLIGMADVVALVADARRSEITAMSDAAAELLPWLARDHGQVPLVLLANKQDLEGTLGARELAEHLPTPLRDSPGYDISALAGEGIRGGFLGALRSAIVANQDLLKQAASSPDDIPLETPDRLLDLMQAADEDLHVQSPGTDSDPALDLTPPTDNVLRQWPADGPDHAWNSILDPARSSPSGSANDGDWSVGCEPGRILEDEAQALASFARAEQCAKQQEQLLPGDYRLLLVADPDGSLRLWHAHPPVKPLGPLFERLLVSEPGRCAANLHRLGVWLMLMKHHLEDPGLVSTLCTDRLGIDGTRLVYTGPWSPGAPGTRPLRELIHAVALPPLRLGIDTGRIDPNALTVAYQRDVPQAPATGSLRETLLALLLEI
ncbi:MAG: ADP-ribosylation factor-like protein [Gammaproteobacteria bacterium]